MSAVTDVAVGFSAAGEQAHEERVAGLSPIRRSTANGACIQSLKLRKRPLIREFIGIENESIDAEQTRRRSMSYKGTTPTVHRKFNPATRSIRVVALNVPD